MKLLLFGIGIFFTEIIFSQSTYIVFFKNKQIENKKPAISQYALERKNRYAIPIDDKDYAIEQSHIYQINEITPTTLHSKWLNAVSITADEKQLDKIKNLPFVEKIELFKPKFLSKSTNKKLESEYTIKEYGKSISQLDIHNGRTLHDMGFLGENMRIAIFDAGFSNVPNILSYKHLFDENRIFPVKNIVESSDNVYTLDNHGTGVLGCMAAFVKDSIIASAPKASYYLFISEDPRSESRLEEFNWAIAAEMADSIGVDIINSSLGYHHFDDPTQNYAKQDMNGETTIISKAAAIAAKKGILVVNSAGNHGNKDWHIITAPADVEGVVSVGAIDIDKHIADFSSRGYNAKNVIKPNIVAVGKGTLLYYDTDGYHYGSGTSFSSPLMAGLLACFWQKNRHFSAEEIKQLVYKKSSNFLTPNPEFGFGIPDFEKLKDIYSNPDNKKFISVYPNPSLNNVIIEFQSDEEFKNSEYSIYFANKTIINSKMDVKKGINQLFVDTEAYSKGIYFFKILLGSYKTEARFIVD